MRGFFVLLLLTNILFLVWQKWFEPVKAEAIPYGGVAIVNEGLPLLSELDEDVRPSHRGGAAVDRKEDIPVTVIDVNPAEKSEAKPKAPSALSAASLCYQSTAVESLDEAKVLQQKLEQLGVKESLRETIQTQKTNYWVMLAAYKNRDKANEAAEILRQKRIKDFFIVRSGRYENAISLGVYSTKERANERFKEIIALQARLRKPVIEAIELPAKRLVVTFQIESASESADISALLGQDKEPGLKKIPCN